MACNSSNLGGAGMNQQRRFEGSSKLGAAASWELRRFARHRDVAAAATVLLPSPRGTNPVFNQIRCDATFSGLGDSEYSLAITHNKRTNSG